MPDVNVHPETASDSPFRYGPWNWREPSHEEHYRTCSFCGSVSPEDLAAEPTWRADWADRKYGWPHKFYVDIPNREPDKLFVIGKTSRFKEEDRGRYVPVGELTEEQLEIVKRDGWSAEPGCGVYFGKRPYHHAKFYTIHLSDAELSAETKKLIERKSGLEFNFLANGRVAWKGVQY